MVLFSMALTVLLLAIQPGYFNAVKVLAKESDYLMPLLNGIPIFLMISLVYFLCANLYVATSFTYILFVGLSYLNRNKIIFRDEPFTPADFLLGKEAFTITTRTGYDVDYKLLFILLSVLIFTNLFLYIVNIPKPAKKIRMSFLIVILVSASLSYAKVYKSTEIWHKLPCDASIYNVTENYKAKGFVYSFIHHIDANKIKKPKGFNKDKIEALLSTPESTVKNKPIKPNVVMIMGEAFSDISRDAFFKFDTIDDDPMRYYKEIEKEAIISGHITVSSFGGGTANTEFDVLTGNATTLLSETTLASFKVVRRPLNSIVRVLNNEGYQTLGIHPGYDWFYNRKNVYNYLGFQKMIFEDDFKNRKIICNLISEISTTERLLEEYEKAKKNTPFFEYCVTIQNHGPYTVDKYNSRVINRNFTTKKEISALTKDSFAVYFEGVRDMDLQIHTLTEYFKSIDEPVIFIYYGDHLPFLGADKAGFSDMNYGLDDGIEGVQKLYEVPYLIWGNQQALSMIDNQTVRDFKNINNKTINASYIGAMLLELLNLNQTDPFFDFLNKIKYDLPVAQRDFVVENNKASFELKEPTKLSERELDVYNLYKQYIYYNMKYNRVDSSTN